MNSAQQTDDRMPSAWGLGLECPALDPATLLPGPSHWPRVTIGIRTGDVGAGPDYCDDQRAEVGLSGAGKAILERSSLSSTLIFPETPSADALLHPHLASTATIVNWWLGRNCFHAGAFLCEGRAWALLGDRGHGKSSTLAWLHRSGTPVVTDDVLAVGGGQAFAGPRCLDLRQEPAERLGVGRYLGMVGTRERWRVTLPPVEAECPLGGWVFLDWADSISITRLSPSEVLGRLLPFLAVGLLPDPAELLHLAAMPAYVWARPKSWDVMAESSSALVAQLTAPARTPVAARP